MDAIAGTRAGYVTDGWYRVSNARIHPSFHIVQYAHVANLRGYRPHQVGTLGGADQPCVRNAFMYMGSAFVITCQTDSIYRAMSGCYPTAVEGSSGDLGLLGGEVGIIRFRERDV
jgi:hypothetical protein